jgi:release factor glutamine methyltransferase
MLSWGRLRQALQPVVLKYWLDRRSQKSVITRMHGLKLEVLPGVFHPKYFGSSAILANFVSSLPLNGKSFLEIGCGSGIVAMCAAMAGGRVAAVDINPAAVRCTAGNAAKNNIFVDVRLSDLFAALDEARYDVIAWNPPFLPGIPKSPAEAAFYGGPDFDTIRRFAAEVHNHLQPGGSIYTILSDDIDVAQIAQLFRDRQFTVSQVLAKRWGLGETMVILCAR